MRKLLSILFLIPACVLADVTDVDVLVDMEAGSDDSAVSVSLLNTATKAGAGFPAGTWSKTGDWRVSVAHEVATLGSFKVGATTYTDAGGTRGFRLVNPGGNTQHLKYTFTGRYAGDFSIGCWISIPDGSANSPTVDLIWAEQNVDWAVAQYVDYGTPQIWMHTDAGEGPGITFAYDTWYWLTFEAKRNATCRLRLYTTTGTLVGTSTLPNNSAATWEYVSFGKADAHGNYPSMNSSVIAFDDIVMDFTDTTWPLGPGVASDPPFYWVSSNGAASWANANSGTPLSGTACASVATMNANVGPGDIVNFRAGTSTAQIAPAADGTALNPIILQSYTGEQFTISNRTSVAIELANRDYIEIYDIDAVDVQFAVNMDNSKSNTISGCVFSGKNNQTGWPIGITIDNNSKFNVITNCTVTQFGYSSGATDNGGVVDMGQPRITPSSDDTSFNMFINSTLGRGGHHVIDEYSHDNFYIGCHFYNDEWMSGNTEGNRVIVSERGETGDQTTPVAYYGSHTFRDCTFYRSGSPTPDDTGVSIMSLRTQRNRVIRCVFLDGSEGGLNINANSSNSLTANDNHVANSTMVNNGINTQSTFGPHKGGVTMNISGGGTSVINNELKNLLMEDNFQDFGFENVASSSQVFSNNFLEATGDPLFTAWDSGTLDPTNPASQDFTLTGSSPAIDFGGFLTTISTATGSGTSFTVADSYWFTDGNGIATADTIQLQGSATVLTVTDVNYSTHVITFTPSISWTTGDGVAFPYNGPSPDAGAFESILGTVATPTATLAAGLYYGNQNNTLSTSTGGASIYYTVDGSTPTTNSTLYSTTLVHSAGLTLKAIATKAGETDSGIITRIYEIGSWQAGTAWKNVAITSQSADFTCTFDVTPGVVNQDLVLGFAFGVVSDYTGASMLPRWDISGIVDARNGASYAAVNVLNYGASLYHASMTVNWSAKTYSLTVTPDGQSPVVIATDYAFRDSAPTPASINYLAFITATGNATVSNLVFGGAPSPPMVMLRIEGQMILSGKIQ